MYSNALLLGFFLPAWLLIAISLVPLLLLNKNLPLKTEVASLGDVRDRGALRLSPVQVWSPGPDHF